MAKVPFTAKVLFTPNPTPQHPLWRHGEDLAQAHLTSLGHRILGRNLRVGRGEIDLLTRYGSSLHIVEVKSGHHHPHFSPELHFNWRKRRQLRCLTHLLPRALIASCTSLSIDLVAVAWSLEAPQGHYLRYYPNVG